MPRDGRTPSTGCITTVLAVVVVVGGALSWVAARNSDGDAPSVEPESTSTSHAVATTDPPSEEKIDQPAPVVPDVDEYTITYRVEAHSGNAVLVDTEVRRFRSPFEAEVRLLEGEPGRAEAPLRERSAQVMGGSETANPDQDAVVLTVVPGSPTRLGHFAGDLGRAVADGLVEVTNRRLTVASHECDVYRTRAPLDVPRLEPATDEDYTDLCITTDGLVLRESWHTGGTLFRRRTAVDVSERSVPDDAFDLTGHRIPDSQGGGRLRQLTPDSTAPGVDHLLPTEIPAGFEPQGRFVYVADQVDTGAASVDVGRTVSLVDVFVSDDHHLSIENGGGTSRSSGPSETGGTAIELPRLENARAVVSTHQNEVVATTGEGRFVRLTSTMPLERLIALARDLAPVPGTGEVTPLNDELDVTGRMSPEDLAEHEHDDAPDGEHTHDGATHTHD